MKNINFYQQERSKKFNKRNITMEKDDKDIFIIFLIILFFSVMSYLSGFYTSKAHSAKVEVIKVIENMIDKISVGPSLDPLTENEFNDLQSLMRVRKMIAK